MRTIKPYEEALKAALEQLLESVYTIIPKEIEIENHRKYVDDEYSNHRWEYQMEKDSFVREIVTEMMGLNENEEGFAEREETILMLKELVLHKPVLRFKSYFENAIKDESIKYYSTNIIEYFKEKVELEGVSTEDFPTLIDFISKCVIKTVFLTKTDGKLSLYFGIRTEIHYELLKKVVDTFIELSMIWRGYNMSEFMSEIISENEISIIKGEFHIKEIIRKSEFENDYRPLFWETMSYHLQNKIEYLKTKHLLSESQIIEPPKTGAGKEKKVSRNEVKKATKERYDLKLYEICDLVENKWRKEKNRTVEQLEKVFKKVKGEYAISKKIDRSQLNTELKNTDNFNYIKNKLLNLYGENK